MAEQELSEKEERILEARFEKEEQKFRNKIQKGLNKLNKIIQREEVIDGHRAFYTGF